MSKFTKKNKSCYITIFCQTNTQAKNLGVTFLKKGYFHFYFNSLQNNYIFINEMLKLQNIYPKIKLFIAHDSRLPFWIMPKITNLPVNVEQNKSVEDWLKTYCETF